MQHRSARPGRGCEPVRSPPREAADDPTESIGADVTLERPPPYEVAFARVEYLIRPARITDIERLVALADGLVPASARVARWTRRDLLRQLVYLPQASIFIAEAHREVVGGAVLALRRPS